MVKKALETSSYAKKYLLISQAIQMRRLLESKVKYLCCGEQKCYYKTESTINCLVVLSIYYIRAAVLTTDQF